MDITASVLGIPLTFVVYGVVAFLGKMGVSGRSQLASALGTGLLVGFFYQFAMVAPPVSAGDWFSYIIYGLALGLLASGIYEGNKQAAG